LDITIVAVIFALQIGLAVWMWNYYQNAKRDLNARAAENPMLTEVSSLQRTVKELLVAVEEAAQDTTARMEVRCAEARFLLGTLEERLSQLEVQEVVKKAISPPSEESSPNTAELLLYEVKHHREEEAQAPPPKVEETISTEEAADREYRYQRAYALAEIGMPMADIARETELPEGEIELMLRLRGHGVEASL
jgi:hypothetical protein